MRGYGRGNPGDFWGARRSGRRRSRGLGFLLLSPRAGRGPSPRSEGAASPCSEPRVRREGEGVSPDESPPEPPPHPRSSFACARRGPDKGARDPLPARAGLSGKRKRHGFPFSPRARRGFRPPCRGRKKRRRSRSEGEGGSTGEAPQEPPPHPRPAGSLQTQQGVRSPLPARGERRVPAPFLSPDSPAARGERGFTAPFLFPGPPCGCGAIRLHPTEAENSPPEP